MKKRRSDIIEICRWLRQHATPAERQFWALVRNRQILHQKFYRQHPLRFIDEGGPGYFVADFYCPACRLVVEIDGGIHEQQQDYDRLRTQMMNEMDIQVLRFENHSVLEQPDLVQAQLEERLRACLASRNNTKER